MQSEENFAVEQPSEETTLSQLLQVSKTVLQQGVDLLDNHIVSNEQLVTQSQYLPGSTIGKHLRHSRDHFELLLDCIESLPPYVLSYDVRLRNTPMEGGKQAARDALAATIQRLDQIIPRADASTRLTLQALCPAALTHWPRQLWFAALHCVHHWSMVRVIAGELNIKLASDFGFAPSTLVYQGRDDAPLGKAKI
ncbi:hypothetical protein FB45DRAFT_978918 [Roridomyces roridus]|uniref:DinB-like domain-containing protein n=1 Tax=Roridomyces roridus TaxID=1738132 RepID=A0AAD7FPE6_9AGAR|nr:hypothetical protein FB45DRAFT_978918 [Roridomyces roridus]